jgi:hypothetical protein
MSIGMLALMLFKRGHSMLTESQPMYERYRLFRLMQTQPHWSLRAYACVSLPFHRFVSQRTRDRQSISRGEGDVSAASAVDVIPPDSKVLKSR